MCSIYFVVENFHFFLIDLVYAVGILFFFFSKGSDEVVRQKAVNEVSKERLLGRKLLISPFVNRSGSSDHNYLSEGITDHLISSLIIFRTFSTDKLRGSSIAG